MGKKLSRKVLAALVMHYARKEVASHMEAWLILDANCSMQRQSMTRKEKYQFLKVRALFAEIQVFAEYCIK